MKKTIGIIVGILLVIGFLAGMYYIATNNTRNQIAQEQAEAAKDQELADLKAEVEQLKNAAVSAPTANPTPVATAAPVSNADTSGLVTEQNYIPHPRFYQETGIEGTKTWKNVIVNDDEYLVVGGVVVNGVKDGAYQGYGPGTYAKITVTNGFLSIVDDDWGANEFDFRVDQAVTYGWAHAHIDRGPIPE